MSLPFLPFLRFCSAPPRRSLRSFVLLVGLFEASQFTLCWPACLSVLYRTVPTTPHRVPLPCSGRVRPRGTEGQSNRREGHRMGRHRYIEILSDISNHTVPRHRFNPLSLVCWLPSTRQRLVSPSRGQHKCNFVFAGGADSEQPWWGASLNCQCNFVLTEF